jgi:hypothetical protein
MTQQQIASAETVAYLKGFNEAQEKAWGEGYARALADAQAAFQAIPLSRFEKPVVLDVLNGLLAEEETDD